MSQQAEKKQGKTTHGMGMTSEYTAWANMLARCRNERNPTYKNYGARGISVCEKWVDFRGFIEDMGFKPGPDYSLERIRVNGNYEPGNCVWIPKSAQANNRRNTVRVTIFGITASLSEWARCVGMTVNEVNKGVWKGYSDQKALGLDDISIAWG